MSMKETLLKVVSSNDDGSHESLRNTEDISAFLDGEITDFDLEQFEHEENVAAWADYTLIGDVMRSSDLAAQPRTALQSKIFAALEDEPAHQAPATPDVIKIQDVRKRSRLLYLVPGLAAAAAVATVTWVTLPMLENGAVVNTGTPTILSGEARVEFNEYVRAHRNFAGFSPYVSTEMDPRLVDVTTGRGISQ